jgi:hypothetical protein
VFAETGVTEPEPFSVIATFVALPPNVLLLTVTGVTPHVLPFKLLNKTVGPLRHPHETEKEPPMEVQPAEFLTVIVWFPFDTPEKTVAVWYTPSSSRYWRPEPKGLVTVTVALPDPREQSTVCEGMAGDPGAELTTTLPEAADLQPVELVTVKVYVPGGRPETVVLVPDPVVTTSPGVLIKFQVPDEGNPLNITLPVGTAHVGCVTVPVAGAAGMAFTVKLYVVTAAVHGDPTGLLVVTVIITVLPASPDAGVYVKENGDVPADVGLTEPAPFSVIVTFVALPPKVFPFTDTEVVPHVLPLVELRVTTGGFMHGQDTEKPAPVEVHKDAVFLTVIVWFPLTTFAKTVLVWYVPASNLYSRPVPTGLVTVTVALPGPNEQLIVCKGVAGVDGCVFITTLEDGNDVHPEAVTVKVYVPAGIPEIVILVPDPGVTTPPGLLVIVQDPFEGKPLSTTLPVATAHVGCVLVPTVGAGGGVHWNAIR